MITINTDKQLVRIERWDDILERPGFTPNLDHKGTTLQAVLGSYSFRDEVICGLAECRQPHMHGFLVSTTDGRETNIGNRCGRKHFGTNFVLMRRALKLDITSKTRREYLTSIKSRLPELTGELDTLKRDERGAGWIHTKVSQLLGKSGSLPDSIVQAIRGASRHPNGALTMARKLSREDRQLAETVLRGASGRTTGHVADFVDEIVGQLEGHAVLTRDASLREFLPESLRLF